MKPTNTIKLNKVQNAAANALEGVCVIKSLAGTGKTLVLTTRIHNIRARYPEANIVAIDYDPGASEVNQVNRIKLMLATANKNLHKKLDA